MSEQEWITVLTSNDEIDVNLKKGLLEQAGIQCVIDASILRAQSATPASSQYNLNIPKKSLTEAQEVLKDVL